MEKALIGITALTLSLCLGCDTANVGAGPQFYGAPGYPPSAPDEGNTWVKLPGFGWKHPGVDMWVQAPVDSPPVLEGKYETYPRIEARPDAVISKYELLKLKQKAAEEVWHEKNN